MLETRFLRSLCMPETTAMVRVLFHYWAGARAAAGMADETVQATSVAEAMAAVFARHADHRFECVVRASALLVDGLTAHETDLRRPLDGPVEVEVLPPFAGG